MMSRTPLRVWVVLAAGLLAISWSPILVRYASAAPGQALAFWRTVFAALLLAPVAGLKARRAMRALTRRDLMLIGAAGVMLGLHFIAWIESLYYTSVASASVLVTTSPLFIAVLGFLVLRERLTVRTMAAIGGAVVGAALIGMADAGASFPMLGSAMVWRSRARCSLPSICSSGGRCGSTPRFSHIFFRSTR